MEFESCWERIVSNTNIRNLSQLADIVGTTQPTVTKKKQKKVFPVEWAYLIGQEYNLLTEWILKGEGPKRLEKTYRLEAKKEYRNPFMNEIDEWLYEISKDDPRKPIWFEIEFESKFELFKEWKQKREQDESEGYKFGASQNAA